ncbi:F(420)H(2) dehydrogenase subunit I [uncultured archaeon]|nr:F(420)H(2) dehydrogenase subunit I [uncultured archaeon]
MEPLVKTIKSLGDKRATLEFPEERQSLDDTERYMMRLDMDTCVSCSACARICPNKTIRMVETVRKAGTKVMPEIGIDRCLFCGMCEEVCPTKCLTLTKGYDLEATDKRKFVKRPEDLRG